MFHDFCSGGFLFLNVIVQNAAFPVTIEQVRFREEEVEGGEENEHSPDGS